MNSKYVLFFIALLFALPVQAEIEPIAAEYESRYHNLLAELRCLVCQNQTIAESNAELAVDLRNEVKRMLAQGSTDKDIIDFMSQRYGDFVLYKPLVKPKTYLLWFGPFVFLAAVLLIMIIVVMRQQKTTNTTLSAEEQEKLKSILDQDSE